jgi:hypothetical protein
MMHAKAEPGLPGFPRELPFADSPINMDSHS